MLENSTEESCLEASRTISFLGSALVGGWDGGMGKEASFYFHSSLEPMLDVFYHLFNFNAELEFLLPRAEYCALSVANCYTGFRFGRSG